MSIQNKKKKISSCEFLKNTENTTPLFSNELETFLKGCTALMKQTNFIDTKFYFLKKYINQERFVDCDLPISWENVDDVADMLTEDVYPQLTILEEINDQDLRLNGVMVFYGQVKNFPVVWINSFRGKFSQEVPDVWLFALSEQIYFSMNEKISAEEKDARFQGIIDDNIPKDYFNYQSYSSAILLTSDSVQRNNFVELIKKSEHTRFTDLIDPTKNNLVRLRQEFEGSPWQAITTLDGDDAFYTLILRLLESMLKEFPQDNSFKDSKYFLAGFAVLVEEM